jgi:hypothetical protein
MRCGCYKIDKNINEFSPYFHDKKGSRCICKTCNNAKSKKHRENNIEQVRENDRQRYANRNEEQIIHDKEYRKQYRETHKEDLAKTERSWYDKNKEYRKAYNQQYYQENKEDIIAYATAYNQEHKNERNAWLRVYVSEKRKTDIVFRVKCNVSASFNGYLKRYGFSKNKISIEVYMGKFGYTVEQLISHLENLFEPWMTWENWGKYDINTWDDNNSSTWTWNIDHIIPISHFEIKSEDDPNIIKCWALSNLRPLSAKQNIIDGNRR